MTGEPSQTHSAEHSLPTGARHPVLEECLRAGKAFREETEREIAAKEGPIYEALQLFKSCLSQPSEES